MTTYNFVPARNRKYGWLPDRPDKRDKLYAALPIDALPEKVSLRHLCSAVEDQGSLSSCVGNACAGMLEALENKNSNTTIITTPAPLSLWGRFLCAIGWKKTGCTIVKTVSETFQEVSRLFIYYNGRARDGLEKYDRGCYIRSALKSLNTLGYCWEPLWGYDYNRVNVKPELRCYEDAKPKVITEYRSLLTNAEMMTCLAEGYPFVIGLSIFTGFDSSKARLTGVIDMPKPSEASLGGHAVLCVGYDRSTKRFLMKNSWGEGWGDNGYFTIPFDYVAGYGSDAWTIRK